jgi:hypothetical protein
MTVCIHLVRAVEPGSGHAAENRLSRRRLPRNVLLNWVASMRPSGGFHHATVCCECCEHASIAVGSFRQKSANSVWQV